MTKINWSSNEERNKYFREYRKKHREELRDYNRKYNKEWRKENGFHNETNSKYRYPLKMRARRIIENEIRQNRLIRGNCIRCGKTKAQAHHEDYSKPLEIIWLCSLHHRERHKMTCG